MRGAGTCTGEEPAEHHRSGRRPPARLERKPKMSPSSSTASVQLSRPARGCSLCESPLARNRTKEIWFIAWEEWGEDFLTELRGMFLRLGLIFARICTHDSLPGRERASSRFLLPQTRRFCVRFGVRALLLRCGTQGAGAGSSPPYLILAGLGARDAFGRACVPLPPGHEAVERPEGRRTARAALWDRLGFRPGHGPRKRAIFISAGQKSGGAA